MTEAIRTFDTGATRDSEDGKLDFEGFLSPLAEERFAQYMQVHCKQSDGSLRDSDNWQKGIPLGAYVKSMVRHVWSVCKIWRGWQVLDERDGHEVDLEEALCGVKFNVNGLLHELVRRRCVASRLRISVDSVGAQEATADFNARWSTGEVTP